MDFTTLKNSLGLENGVLKSDQVVIATNLFTPNLNTLLEYCYDNQPIIIDHAYYVCEDATNQRVTIKGQSNFLGVVGLETEGRFSLDAQGQVQLCLKYTLIGSQPSANAWRFSTSFPNLPQVTDLNEPTYFDRDTQQVSQTMIVPLDGLFLFDTYYVVVSQPQPEPDFKVDLNWGINFVSHLRPQGFLAIIEALVEQTAQLTLSGTIRKPLPTETPQQVARQYAGSLARLRYPWDVESDFPQGLPGILLQVALNLNYSIVNDKIRFSGDKLYLYTPLDNNWLLPETNPSFAPIQACTGSVELCGAGITMNMVAPVQIGVDALTLISSFEGVSLSNLSQLTSLTGSSDSPLHELPVEIQQAGDVLGQLSLVNAKIEVDYTDPQDVEVSYVSFTVGMPDLKWQVWDDHFEIDSIYCAFDIDYPFSTIDDPDIGREVTVTVYGRLEIEAVPFNVYASSQEGFTVYAEMAEQQTLPLKKILEVYAPDVPPPSDLTINIFRVGIAPRQAYSMALALAQEPQPWLIPVGPHSLLVEDVAMGFTYPKGGPIQGSVSGTIKFGEFVQLSILYDLPGDIIIRTLIPQVSLRQLLSQLTDQAVSLPRNFDLQLTNSSVLLKKQADDYVFQLGTEVENSGSLAFQVQRVGPQWGFALGLDLHLGQPSDLAGLSEISRFLRFFALEKFLLVVSSFDNPGFTFPDLAAFNNPTIRATNISLPSQTTGVVAGLTLYALWNFDNSRQQQLLKKFLRLDNTSLGVALQIGEDPAVNSKLLARLNTTVAGLPLNAQFGGQIQNGEVSLFLIGTLQAEIQGQLTQFEVTLLFVANGAFISGSMVGTVTFEGLTLSNLALLIGLDWEGIPSLGIAATLTVEHFQSSLAIFFDSADPTRSLLAGAISDLSLQEVLDTFTGNVLPSEVDAVLNQVALVGTSAFTLDAGLVAALDNLQIEAVSTAFAQQGVSLPAAAAQVLLNVGEPGQHWFLTDLTTMLHYELVLSQEGIRVTLNPQFYCAPQTTFIGALRFDQGLFINTGLEILSFNATAKVLVEPNQGISVDGHMARLVIGTEALFSLESSDGQKGPHLSAATFNQPDAQDTALKSPHFLLDGSLNLLGLKWTIYIYLNSNGFTFDIKDTVMPGFNVDLHGHFSGPADMATGGALTLGIGAVDLGPLGKTNIGTGVTGALDVGVKDKDIWAKFSGRFDFAGQKLTLPPLDLDIQTAALAALPDKLPSLVVEALQNFLRDPAEAKDNYWHGLERWLRLVRSGVITGVDDVGSVVKTMYGVRVVNVAYYLKDAGYTANEVGQVFKNAYGVAASDVPGFGFLGGQYGVNEVAGVLKDVYSIPAGLAAQLLHNYAPNDVADALKNTYGVAADQAVKFLKEAGFNYLVNSLGDILKNTYGVAADQVVSLLKGAGFASNEVGFVLKNSYAVTVDQAAQWFRGVGYSANEVADMVKNTYGGLADGAAKVLRGAGYSTNEVAGALKTSYGVAADQAVSLLRGVGYTADEVNEALKNIYGQSVDQVVSQLKGAGRTVSEVGNILKNTYGVAAGQAVNLLKGAGYVGNDIANVLKNTYGEAAGQAVSLLKGAGYVPNDVGYVLQNTYGMAAEQAAQSLRGAGYAANEVGDVLKNGYSATADQTAQSLRGAGYAANEVGDVLKNGYSATADQTAQSLRGASYSVNEVGDVLKNGFSATADQTAQSLRGAGYTVDEVGGYVKDAFSLGPDQLKDVLQGVGFEVNQIKDLFQSMGGAFKDIGDRLNPTKWW